MPWDPTPEKGGLKGGYMQSPTANPFQRYPLFNQAPRFEKQLKGSAKASVHQSKLGPHPASTSVDPSPSNSEAKVASKTGVQAADGDYIHSALKLQFSKSGSARSADESVDGRSQIADHIENDVQRILEEKIDFVAAKCPTNALLARVQETCIDISKIPLVRLSYAGETLRTINSSDTDRMCERPLLEHTNGDSLHSAVVHSNGVASSSSPSSSQAVAGTPTSSKPATSVSAAKQQSDDRLPEPKKIFYEESRLCMDWPKSHFQVGSGLLNIGNTCFLNATLQCLAYTSPLFNYLTTESHKQNCKLGGFCITCALQDTLPSIVRARSPFRPAHITQNLKAFAKGLSIGRQEDAHEFLRLLVEAMRKSAMHGFNLKQLDPYSQETTVASRIFGGFYRSRVLCHCCKHPSSTYDPFMDVPLDIGKSVATLESALESFTRPEQLNSPNNLYKCERCRKMTPASKRVTIHKAPNILTFQLKRFLYTGSSYFSKIDKSVQFPEAFNLRPYMSEGEGSSDVMYRLYGVLVHMGGSCHSGHYFSYIRAASGSWHKMDDCTVRQVGKGEVLNQRAYLLFYSRELGSAQVNGHHATLSSSVPPVSSTKVVLGPTQTNGAKRQPIQFGIKRDQNAGEASGKPQSERPSTPRPPLAALPVSNDTNKPRLITAPARIPVTTSLASSRPGSAQSVGRTAPSPARLPASVPTATNGPLKPSQFVPRSVQLAQPKPPVRLVPYEEDDDEDEVKPPEPISSNSSTSSQSSKENKDMTVPRSPKMSAAEALKEVFRDSPSPEKLVGQEAFPPSNQSSDDTEACENVTSEPAPGKPDLVEADAQNEVEVSPKERRREKKLRKKIKARLKAEAREKEPDPVAVNEEPRKKKKKKKSKKRMDSGEESAKSSSPSSGSLVWVEKSSPVAKASPVREHASEPQPEPIQNGWKDSPQKSVADRDSAYGTEVRSWDGGQSVLSQEVETLEREKRKRAFETNELYEQEYDEGRVKKVKNRHGDRFAHSSGKSGFQRVQNYRNQNNGRSKSVLHSGGGGRKSSPRRSDEKRRSSSR